MSVYGHTDHTGHINRTNRAWNPRTEPTPRELDFLRAMHALGDGCRVVDAAARIGIQKKTGYLYRDNLVDLGLIETTGYGCTRRDALSARGRALLAS